MSFSLFLRLFRNLAEHLRPRMYSIDSHTMQEEFLSTNRIGKGAGAMSAPETLLQGALKIRAAGA